MNLLLVQPQDFVAKLNEYNLLLSDKNKLKQWMYLIYGVNERRNIQVRRVDLDIIIKVFSYAVDLEIHHWIDLVSYILISKTKAIVKFQN